MTHLNAKKYVEIKGPLCGGEELYGKEDPVVLLKKKHVRRF